MRLREKYRALPSRAVTTLTLFGLALGLDFKRAGRGDHFQLWIVLENSNEPVDEARFQGRLVALNVDDVPEAAQSGGDLGDSIGAALDAWARSGRLLRQRRMPLRRCACHPWR